MVGDWKVLVIIQKFLAVATLDRVGQDLLAAIDALFCSSDRFQTKPFQCLIKIIGRRRSFY